MSTRSDAMQPLQSVIPDRAILLRKVAERAFGGGNVIGFCRKCGKEREYDIETVVKMMAKGLPRHCGGKHIELRPA